MASSKVTIDVALGVLINAEGRLLFSQRPQNVFMPHYWEFPGGKVEPDEAPLAALHRELHEELAVEIESPKFIHTFVHEYPDRIVRLHSWKITDFSPEPTGAEGQKIRWMACDVLDELQLLPGSQLILQRL